MTTKAETRRSLRDLLDRLVAAQKEDICAYSSGHLNESKLFRANKVTSLPRAASWATSRCESSRKHGAPTPPHGTNSADMQNALKGFALGLGGTILNHHDISKASSKSTRTDHVRFDINGLGSKSDEPILTASSEENRKQSVTNLNDADGHLLPRHLESLTKAEEFNRLRAYENQVLEKEKLLQRSFGSGKEMVESLESKLDVELEQLDKHGFGPGFHQLEAYSRTFDGLISTTSTFGPLLEAIKRSYDLFLSQLLNGRVTKHKVLQSQLSQLTDVQSTNIGAVKDEAESLAELEQRVKKAAKENNRLRAEVRKEKEVASQPTPDAQRLTVERPEHTEPSERIEKLNAAVCDVLDRMKQLREKIRRDCVPTTVCTYLRRCVKETDVDIQQMASQKEYYEHSISELTADLQEAIDTADTTERDSRKIWKHLELHKKAAQPSLTVGGLWGGVTFTSERAKEGLENEEEDEEEADKWNWYIS